MDAARARLISSRDRGETVAGLRRSFHLSPGPLAERLAAGAPRAISAAAGLWQRDPAVWSSDISVQRTIANRLGWLSSPKLMADSIGRLRRFAEQVKDDGFTDVVLLGMGGSSLAPEVLRAVIGTVQGWPRFQMLDSTDPAAVLAAETPPETTIYILASKSGTTIEPNSTAAHFRQRLEAAHVPAWADHFVAITDEGTPLAARAREERFRELFVNPSDIGGRYSALSFFGLVPSALMGQEIEDLAGWGLAMLEAASDPHDPMANAAVGLGLLIGEAARAGRDKLTLILPPALRPFGLWVEQLIAESTGKHGKGVIPIAGETFASAHRYGPDRVFVHVVDDGQSIDDSTSNTLRELQNMHVPIATIALAEPLALGAEFVRWEIATAIAGAILEINPFDEPNVQQAKDATGALLKRYQRDGQLSAQRPDTTLPGGVTLTLTTAVRQKFQGEHTKMALTLLDAGDYFAILAYLGPDPTLRNALQAFATSIGDAAGVATMFGYGPRYLHSTGQLHKGGPNTGVFVLVTATPPDDVGIPGAKFTFATLEMAQALGDFASLDATGRRAVHIHLPSPEASLLERSCHSLLEPVQAQKR